MPSANGFAVLPEQEIWAGADGGPTRTPRSAPLPSSSPTRRVLIHMIEETTRHADLLREAVDGQTGE